MAAELISSPNEIDWIAVDWGTSMLRAWGIARNGSVLVYTSSTDGMQKLAPHEYEEALLGLVSPWIVGREHAVTVLICGMAGARGGWREVPYRTVPCMPVETGIAVAVETLHESIEVGIVPGLCQERPADVMRGEETQLAGLLAQLESAEAVVCMPGTHSKWVLLRDGQVRWFQTFMTGELFSILSDRSVLRLSIAPEGDDQVAFTEAVEEMLGEQRPLTAALFAIRADSLLNQLQPDAARSRLSGLLIGAELVAMRHVWQDKTVHVVGTEALCDSYTAALSKAGAMTLRHDADGLAISGLAQVRGISVGRKD